MNDRSRERRAIPALLLGFLVAAVTMVGSCDTNGDAEQRDLAFYFFGEGIGSETTAADVDLAEATFVVTDSDIVGYVWADQQLLLSEGKLEDMYTRLVGSPAVPFVMSVDGTPRVRGAILWEGSATWVDGSQIRYSREGFWLTTGEWPDSSALTKFGLSDDLIDSIRTHMDETGRLR